ncbi:MAG: response regulator receiver domain [Pseudomonadota bacterium]
MTRTINTVNEYSEYAAGEFLQTVVFVDDRIYESRTRSIADVGKVVSPRSRKKAVRSLPQKERIAAEAVAETERDEFSPYEIVTSFAKKQIVCSLYQPSERAKVSTGSDVFPLCRAADIAIVDWDLYGDSGQRTLELISGLIQQAVNDVPEQLRLILVYTQETNLFEIANRLYQKVNTALGDVLEPVQEEGGLAFRTANSRVSILGKAGRPRPNVDAGHIVEEKDLANAAVREFAKLADGILHAAALLGLAEIKKNSRRILSKFNRKLDPAFLTHIAMTLPEDDASNQVAPLLVSEIESVLQDALPSPLVSDAVKRDWCRNVWQPGEHLDAIFNQDDLDKRALAEAICVTGFEKAKSQFNGIPKLSSKRNTRKAARILLGSEVDDGNHRFGRLLASRTFYGDAASNSRQLKLGTIVFRRRAEKYLLCVQPVCDSVRLDSATNFLFVELIVVDDDSKNQPTHIVESETGDLVELIYKPKSVFCSSATFDPVSKTRTVQSKLYPDKKWGYSDVSGRRYNWIDELKISHAQRAVERLASDLSRVGLTESEWLRRLSGS